MGTEMITKPSKHHERFLWIADFGRYTVYDRAIANYRKKHGKEAAEAATQFRFHLIDDRLYFALEANEKPVAFFEICLVGDRFEYKLRSIVSLPEAQP